jgi:hypothetical protein
MRKVISVYLLFISISCFAQRIEIDGIRYKIVGKEAYVTKADYSVKNVIILDKISHKGKTYRKAMGTNGSISF